MTYFFDTSALVKHYFPEKGTLIVRQIIQNEDNLIFISELSVVEMLSAFHTKFRIQQITEIELEVTVSSFINTLKTYEIKDLTSLIREKAAQLIIDNSRIRALRTLDAFQLATFLTYAEIDWLFVSSDLVLCEIVRKLGHNTFDPSL